MAKEWHELRTRGEHLSDSTIEIGMLMLRDNGEYLEVNDDVNSPEEKAMHLEPFLYSDVDGVTKRKHPKNVDKELKQIERGEIAGYKDLRELVNTAHHLNMVNKGSLLGYMVDEERARPKKGGLTH